MRNLDLALVRTFVATVQTGTVTAAARHLNLTQAAASLQLKRLEQAFDCKLLNRSRRGSSLTPQGERLLAHARRLLHDHDALWATMTAPPFEGDVRLGMPSDLVRTYGTPVLRRFARTWPRVRVTLQCDTSGRLLRALDAGEVDLAMTVETDRGAHGETLREDRLVWAGAHGGRAHQARPLPLSTGDDTCPHRPVALKALADAGRDWRLICEVASFEPICATLEADIAVSPLLASTVPETLSILGADSGLPLLRSFGVNLYRPRTGASALAEELARQIREQHAA